MKTDTWSLTGAARRFLPALLIACCVAEAGAQIDPDDLCTGDPCIISSDENVDAGATLQLDFGTRRVILEAELASGETVVTILAGSFEARGGGQIRGTAGLSISTDGNIVLDGTRTTGTLRFNGTDEAVVTLLSRSGAVSANGRLFLDSDDADSGGGTLNVTSATRIELRGDVSATGGSLAAGGTVDLDTDGDVLVSGAVTLSGGESDGGTLSVLAAGSVRFDGPLVLDGAADQGAGGDIDVTADGDISFIQPLRLRGSAIGPTSCGDAGFLDLVADGTVTIAAEADLRSRIGDCSGGTADIDAAVVLVTAGILLDARGADGSGGDLSIAVEDDFDCRSVLNVTGDTGGSVTVTGDDDLVLSPACVVDASGLAGQVDVQAGGDVTLQGRVTAGSAESVTVPRASLIDVRGCRVTVDEGGSLRSLGTGSQNIVTARSTITVVGLLEATSANVFFLPVGFAPAISGDVIPAPQVTNDPQIVACEAVPTPTPTLPPGVTATFTPTRTSSPTLTASPTPTATPGGASCPGDCDGDGRVFLAEVVTGVNIALGVQPRTRCPGLDTDDSQTIEISEPVAAVASLLRGCE